MKKLIKLAFFTLIVRPLVFILLGMNISGRENLPVKGPGVIAANHNSHLDTLVLMSLFPLADLHRVRPVAASDYFLKNRFISWFALNCIGIIPLNRNGGEDRSVKFKACHEALNNDEILILFPEGSRGDAEKMGRLRKGIYYLLRDRPTTQVTPVLLAGLGRVLPKGEALPVPFTCDVIIGPPVKLFRSPSELLLQLSASYEHLGTQCLTRNILA